MKLKIKILIIFSNIIIISKKKIVTDFSYLIIMDILFPACFCLLYIFAIKLAKEETTLYHLYEVKKTIGTPRQNNK